MIPHTLQEWTLDTITTLLRHKVLEVGIFDFKSKLPSSKAAEEKLRLRKTLASFANTRGGFLIFGVADEKTLEPEDRLIGISPNEEFFEHFQAIASGCTPDIAWTPRVPSLPLVAKGTTIYVIQVHEGKRKPYGVQVDKQYWSFPKRTEGGSTEPLSYAEILDGFNDQRAILAGLRRMKIEVKRMSEHAQRANLEAQGYLEPSDLFRLFRPSALEAASLQVLGYVDTGPLLPGYLGELVSAAAAADTEFERLRNGVGDSAVLTRLVLQALNAARLVDAEIEKTLTKLS
jgi:hypothetical protein